MEMKLPEKDDPNAKANAPPPESPAKTDEHDQNVNPGAETTADHPEKKEGSEVDNKKDDEPEDKDHRDDKDQKDESTEESGAAEADPVPEPEPEPEEDPHTTLEQVSEDIDQFISSLNHDHQREEGNDVVLDIPEEVPRVVEKLLNLVEDKISKHESSEQKVKWCQVPEDDSSFFETVDRIGRLSKTLSGSKLEESHGALMNRLRSIQQRALSYLEEEFRILLDESKTCPPDSHHDHKDQNNKDKENNKNEEQDHCVLAEAEGEHDHQVDQFPGYAHQVVVNLNKIAKEMISGGYESECCEVYIISRRQAFEESMQKLGLEKHSLDDIQKMHWEALERGINSWVKALKQCATVYFIGERKLLEAVFSDYPSLSATIFSNLTRGVFIQLLNFAEGIAMSKRSAEKLFKTLDMYETLRELLPKMDHLFPVECVNQLKAEATTARSRLGEAVICIFCDLENSIKAETGKNPVPGGAVHPLTRYTMNYLRLACEYRETLEQVFKEHSKIERADSTSRPQDQDYDAGDPNAAIAVPEQSPFSVEMMRVMALLDTNLEAKAKLYKDVALSNIFMMNNGRYILQKIKGSAEIHSCMGDTWCRKRSSELRQFHKNYQRETWNRLLNCLNHEGLSVNGKVAKPVLKERFKSFNALFDDIHKTQTTWVVSDEQLQSELRVSISAVMIPAYRSFLGRFAQVLDPGRQTEKYIKFQPEDIETYIDELFDGTPNNTGMFRKKP